MAVNREEPFVWTDEGGREWEVIDCWRPDLTGPRKRLPLKSWRAETRAFVPHGREGDIMLFEFGRIAYRDTTDRILREQLKCAKRVGATAAERMDRNP